MTPTGTAQDMKVTIESGHYPTPAPSPDVAKNASDFEFAEFLDSIFSCGNPQSGHVYGRVVELIRARISRATEAQSLYKAEAERLSNELNSVSANLGGKVAEQTRELDRLRQTIVDQQRRIAELEAEVANMLPVEDDEPRERFSAKHTNDLLQKTSEALALTEKQLSDANHRLTELAQSKVIVASWDEQNKRIAALEADKEKDQAALISYNKALAQMFGGRWTAEGETAEALLRAQQIGADAIHAARKEQP